MPALNSKNTASSLSADLGVAQPSDLETDEEKKRKLLQMQQMRLGNAPSSGLAAQALLSQGG